MRNINAIAAIAARDFLKFVRDRTRIIASFIFPFLFIGALGSSLQANLSEEAGYSFLTFIFTGVLGQVLFQSTAAGIISLIEDRKNDFSQELFISPVSRYTIILGKIVGETLVSLSQAFGIIIFALILKIPITLSQVLILIPVSIVVCLFGGAFGVLVLGNLKSERSANQIFPFILFPQFFLAGVFSPINKLPLLLDILSRISPMRYAVDLVRGVYYAQTADYEKVVLMSPILNIGVITLMFLAFLVFGTVLFINNEKNK